MSAIFAFLSFICFISFPIQLFRRGNLHFELLKLMENVNVKGYDSFIQLFHSFGWAPLEIRLWFHSPIYYTSSHIDKSDPKQVQIDRKLKQVNIYAIASFVGMILLMLLAMLFGER